jgi:arylsulfatase A-like enzyme
VSNTQPNVLLITWDACRYDYALSHADHLNRLVSSNVWFENAIAPSPWSLPSHASIFTGEYPHEHGCHRLDGSIKTDLLGHLSDKGYTTYGISANGFASQRTGFHSSFDEFHYTGGRDLYAEGLNVSGFVQDYFQGREGPKGEALKEVLKTIPGHPHPLKSLANLISVGVGEVSNGSDSLQKVPHPVFAPDSGYCYSPERNTRTLRSVVENHGDYPFFIFMNYMDTHRPYKPRADLQKKHLGEKIPYDELLRLNEEVAYPWKFLEKIEKGSLDENDVEKVKGLYAGEVETADTHLKKAREVLDESGVLDDTLIILTSDHGENLGGVDERGRRRMGHEATVSDEVLRVPLLLAHPELSGRVVDEPVSLKDLYSLILNATDLLNTGGDTVPGLLPYEGMVASQYPATGGQMFFERHPDVPDEIIEHRVSEHSAIAYDTNWKVIAESTGERWAGEDGEKRKMSEAPELLTSTAEDHLTELKKSGDGTNISDGDVENLEALGYI